MFLKQVKVKQFAQSVKKYGIIPFVKGADIKGHFRKIETYENNSPEDIYTVIGVSSLKEGWSEWIGSEEGYQFNQRNSKKVYIVAKSIGKRFKVLPEDIEIFEQSEDTNCRQRGV